MTRSALIAIAAVSATGRRHAMTRGALIAIAVVSATGRRHAMTRGALIAIAVVSACRGEPGPRTERGWRAFQDIAGLLQSPRCLNCHVPGDAPLQGDDGRRHTMNVKRGSDGRGTPALPCTTCHQRDNADRAHAPPGAPDWRMPPPAMRMAWHGLPVDALCEALKDPAHNGGRSLAALEDHLRNDAIVAWAFRPGPGRKPPPMSRPELVARFVEWKDAGAPCAANTADGR